MLDLERKTLKFCKKNFEFKNQPNLHGADQPMAGKKILIACSGGADSTALVLCMNNLKEQLGIKKIGVANIKHTFNVDFAKKSNLFVKRLAKKLNLDFHSGDVSIIKKQEAINSLSPEYKARIMRYTLLQKIFKKGKYNVMLMAHTYDDHVETIFMRLLLGWSIESLEGIKLKTTFSSILNIYSQDSGNNFPEIFRPFLYSVTRKELLDYLKLKHQRYLIDPSNKNTKFLRNFVRLKVIPFIEKKFPNFKDNLYKLGEYIKDCTKHFSKFHLTDGMVKFQDLTENKFLNDMIIKKSLKIKPKELPKIYSLINKKKGHIKLNNGRIVEKEKDKIVVKRFNKKYKTLKLNIPSKIKYYNWQVTAEFISNPNKIDKKKIGKEIFILPDNIKNIIIRTFKPGDWFIPFGMKYRKKLHDYFIDEKIPYTERYSIPLICHEKRVIGILGWRADEITRINFKNRRYIKIEFKKYKNFTYRKTDPTKSKRAC